MCPPRGSEARQGPLSTARAPTPGPGSEPTPTAQDTVPEEGPVQEVRRADPPEPDAQGFRERGRCPAPSVGDHVGSRSLLSRGCGGKAVILEEGLLWLLPRESGEGTPGSSTGPALPQQGPILTPLWPRGLHWVCLGPLKTAPGHRRRARAWAHSLTPCCEAPRGAGPPLPIPAPD